MFSILFQSGFEVEHKFFLFFKIISISLKENKRTYYFLLDEKVIYPMYG
jgi:hypothetical protein